MLGLKHSVAFFQKLTKEFPVDTGIGRSAQSDDFPQHNTERPSVIIFKNKYIK